MIFFDTSVMVAATYESHVHYAPSARVVKAGFVSGASCSVHSLAEMYNSFTRLPPSGPIPPREALRFVRGFSNRLQVISLTPEEYLETIASAAQLNLTKAIIYDSLLLACARKVQATEIFTWNVKHFHKVAPDLADRIKTP